MKMNAEIKAEWLRRLRSGEYTQGKNALRKEEGDRGQVTHCCLGVLCEIYVGETGARWVRGTYPTSLGREFSLEGRTTFPSRNVVEWCEADETFQEMVVTHRGERRTLSQLNDVNGLNFEQIADIIEEQIKGVSDD